MINDLKKMDSFQWCSKDHTNKPFISFNSEAFISFNSSAQILLPSYITIAYDSVTNQIIIAPSDKKMGLSTKKANRSLPKLTRSMVKNNVTFPIKYYIQDDTCSNEFFRATSENVDENILIERIQKQIKKDYSSAMQSDSMTRLLNLYTPFLKKLTRKKGFSAIPLDERFPSAREGFLIAVKTYNPNLSEFKEYVNQQVSRHLDQCSAFFKYRYKEYYPLEKKSEDGKTYEIFSHPNSQKAFNEAIAQHDISKLLSPEAISIHKLQKSGYSRPEICKKLHMNACVYNHHNSCIKKALQNYYN